MAEISQSLVLQSQSRYFFIRTQFTQMHNLSPGPSPIVVSVRKAETGMVLLSHVYVRQSTTQFLIAFKALTVSHRRSSLFLKKLTQTRNRVSSLLALAFSLANTGTLPRFTLFCAHAPCFLFHLVRCSFHADVSRSCNLSSVALSCGSLLLVLKPNLRLC